MSKNWHHIYQLLLDATESCNKFKIYMYTTILNRLDYAYSNGCYDDKNIMKAYLEVCKDSNYPKEYEFVKELINDLENKNA